MTQPPQGPVPPGPAIPESTPPPPPWYAVPPHLSHATQSPDPRFLPPPSKAMAGWALGLAILPCFGIGWFVSVGLAIAVLVRSRDGRAHGKGLAIAALVIDGLWVVVFFVLVAVGFVQDLRADAERDPTGRVSHRDEVSVQKIRTGDCLDYPGLFGSEDEAVASATVDAVPCDQPHQFQAYRSFTIPGDSYPGRDRVEQQATEGCFAAFRDFVGVPYGRSKLEPYYLYPQANSWRLLDDHSVTCLVAEPGRLTTGTLEGSRR
jgi:Septum formation